MAQKAFVIALDPPSIQGSDFRLNMAVSFCDNVAPSVQTETVVVDVAAGALSGTRASARDAIINFADTSLSWTIGNDDVFFSDFSQQLI